MPSLRVLPERIAIAASRSGQHDGTALAELGARSGRQPAKEALGLLEAERGDVLVAFARAFSPSAGRIYGPRAIGSALAAKAVAAGTWPIRAGWECRRLRVG